MYKLTGTEKQINWATDILDSVIHTIDANIKLNHDRAIEFKVPMYENDAKVWEFIKSDFERFLQNEMPASEIIDRRNSLTDYDKLFNNAKNMRA